MVKMFRFMKNVIGPYALEIEIHGRETMKNISNQSERFARLIQDVNLKIVRNRTIRFFHLIYCFRLSELEYWTIIY